MDQNAMIMMISFFIGMFVGLFIPLICVKLYNAIGSSLGEVCDHDEEDQNDR